MQQVQPAINPNVATDTEESAKNGLPQPEQGNFHADPNLNVGMILLTECNTLGYELSNYLL
jgi:hypothetical protein